MKRVLSSTRVYLETFAPLIICFAFIILAFGGMAWASHAVNERRFHDATPLAISSVKVGERTVILIPVNTHDALVMKSDGDLKSWAAEIKTVRSAEILDARGEPIGTWLRCYDHSGKTLGYIRQDLVLPIACANLNTAL